MIKTMINIFLAVLLSFSFSSCEKDAVIFLCPESYNSIKSEPIGLGYIADYPGQEFIIKNDSTYQAAFQKLIQVYQDHGSDLSLPHIDFSKKTLLGKFLPNLLDHDNSINYKYIQKVCLNNNKRNYRYIIKRVRTSYKALFPTTNWILIDKVSQGYSVEFEVIR